MAATYTSTATYSNLTRLELEALRKADFFVGDKALTIGDAASGAEGVVGKGNLNAEPYATGPEVALDDLFPLTPLPQPGLGVSTQNMVAPGVVQAEYAQWVGPTAIFSGVASGVATAGLVWTDNTPGLDFLAAGVVSGDLLLITPTNGAVANEGTVASIRTPGVNTLVLNNLWNPTASANVLTVGADQYNYTIVREGAVKLFAVPGSGPLGREQTFLVVNPTAVAIHNAQNPTLAAIEAERLKNVIPSKYALDTSVDRADWVYSFNALPRSTAGSTRSLTTLGYRVVLYPDVGDGSGPDFSKPVASLNPVIDPAIPAADQRFTIDYKAGVVRFSCAPATGGEIKPAGATNGTNPATGRLNLYAVLWVVDLSLTQGNARTLYGVRTTNTGYQIPGRVVFNATKGAWEIGTTGVDPNALYVKALGIASGASTNPYALVQYSTEFGTVDATFVVPGTPRYFTYRQGSNVWRFVRNDSLFGYGPTDVELTVEDKTKLTLGDVSNPAQGPGGELNPSTLWNGTTGLKGARDTSAMLGQLSSTLLASPYGVAHLKKGRYYLTDKTIYVPPGSTIQGEGAATKILARINSSDSGEVRPAFKVGPNTPWGVWDASAADDALNPYGVTVSPTITSTASGSRIEGADLVWNPVRRVWGQVIALDDDVWFNEIGPDGVYKFSGLGVKVNDTGNSLWNATWINSTNHTGNHYPRIAHHEHTDEYSVVWVDQVVIGVTFGPQVYYRAFSVDLDLTASAPSPSLAFKSAGFLAGLPTRFHDHPSIAIENYTTDGTYRSQVTFWEYETDVTGLVNTGVSGVRRRIFSGGTTFVSSAILSFSPTYGVANEELPIVSSTDTQWDGGSNFLAVWSVRNHVVVTGTAGTLALGTFAHNIGGFDLQSKAILPGSKLHILAGASTAFGTVAPFIPTDQNSTTLTVQAVIAGGAFVWHDLNSSPFADAGPLTWALTPASYIKGAFTTWATPVFSASFDVVNGQREQDDRFYIMETDQPDFVRLSRGGDKWLVVFQGFQANGFLSIPTLRSFADSSFAPSYYDGIGGTPVADTSVYREHVSTCRVVLSDNGTVIYPAPADRVQPTLAARNTGPSAQVYYEMTSGTGTSAIGPSVFTDGAAAFDVDYQGVDSRWGDTRLDGTTYLEITAGPNIGLWTVQSFTPTTLTITEAFVAADAVPRAYRLYRSPSLTEARLSRDIEVSGKSLGTRPPLTTRPDYVTLLRSPMNEAREVAAHNFMHRWDGATPSLMPAVTWTGQDWTIVSPAKNHMRSFTGAYHPTGVINTSLFADAGWYFGQGVTGSRPGGTMGTLVKTFPVGAQIYDVGTSTYLTIVDVYDEHTVVLSGTDPLGGADLSNREYHLILPSLPDYGGFKNQGYRVAEDGQVIASTSYVTFADPPAADSVENVHRNRELMRRVFGNFGSPALGGTFGANYPAAGIATDVIEEGSHRKGDVFFNGVAVGRPKGVNELSADEPPVVALAWGENYFGFVDRITAGAVASRVKRVEFYRQSFGPYNVTLKDFAIDVVDQAGLAVLSRAHVYTNNGGAHAGNIAMATDGYRNVYVYPTRYLGVLTPIVQVQGTEYSRLYGCYTNAEGHHPIHVEVGRPAGNDPFYNLHTWQESAQFLSASNQFPGRNTFQNTTAKVIWDGKRFVVAWVARRLFNTFTPVGWNPFVISLGQLSGGEDGGFQTNELVSPIDTGMDLTPLGSSYVTAGAGSAFVYDNAIAAIDLACSGTTYAVAWVAGCVEDVPNPALGDQAASGSVIGVTIFRLDNATPSNAGPLFPGQTLPGGGQNYVLGQSQFPGTWSNPRIIWTGDKYTVFAQQTYMAPADPTDYREGDSVVSVAHFGPDGPAEPTQVKQQIGRYGGFGAFFRVNDAQPLLPVALNGADLLGLGYPFVTANFSGAVPALGSQGYTAIILTGGEGEVPILATGATGGATAATIWTDAGANFLQGIFGPVREGDLLVVTDVGSTNAGIYVISAVTATTLTVGPSNFGGGFPEAANKTYNVVRPAHPLVQPGDVLVVDGIWDDVGSTLSTSSTGHYPILSYSPKGRVLVIEGQFDPGDIGSLTPPNTYWKRMIRGAIRTGNTANTLLGPVLGRSGSTQSPIKAGDTSWLTDLLTSGSYSTDAGFSKMLTLYDVAYNPERDEYTVLFSSLTPALSIYLWVATYDPRKRQFSAATPLYAGATEAPYGDWKLNWNGRHYLATGETVTSFPFAIYQKAVLLSDGLAIEQVLTLDAYYGAGVSSLLGNGANQVPGVGYGAPGGVDAYPYAKNVSVAWNDKLSRWTISACVQMMTTTWPSTTSNLEPAEIPLGAVTAWGAGSTTVTVGSTQYLQPGMKVKFVTTSGPNLIYHGYVTVISVTNATDFVADATFAEFDTGSGIFTLGGTQAYILPREDVFTWTVGYSAAGISIDDADGVVIENVTFSGQTADVTERWSNMARPIWQAAGQTTGLRWRLPGGGYTQTLLPFNFRNRTGFKPHPQYNHRFLVPRGKVETTRVFGLRSTSKLRFDPTRRGPRAMKGEP